MPFETTLAPLASIVFIFEETIDKIKSKSKDEPITVFNDAINNGAILIIYDNKNFTWNKSKKIKSIGC